MDKFNIKEYIPKNPKESALIEYAYICLFSNLTKKPNCNIIDYNTFRRFILYV